MITFILALIITILCLIFIIGRYNEFYWKRRNVAFYKKHKVMGVFWDFLTKDKAIFENLWEVYKEYPNEPAIGLGSILTPTLYVTHPKNVQHVLIADFNSFNHRGLDVNKDDLLADNILFMEGNRWKLMRQHRTPLFTTTKLKSMYYIIDKSAIDFVTHLKDNRLLLKGDAFNTISSFCCAAIGAAVFGVGTKSIFDSPFLYMTQNAFKSSFKLNLKFSIGHLCNPLYNLLGFSMFKGFEDLIINAIKRVIHEREADYVKRHDFADVCVSLKNAGTMVDKDSDLKLEPTDELLAAQAFFFYTAGVEPIATVIFNTLVELGRRPEYLSKVHSEIDEAFKLHGSMNYDAITSFKVLDMVVNESMRIHTPVGYVTRKCVKDTVLPIGNIKVDKGTKIFIPIFELHHDARYYPDPEVFDPERFSPDNKHNIADITYLPFGRGNRVCLGARYGILQLKAGLVHLLRNFTVKTIVMEEGMKYSRQQFQVRLSNFDLEFIPRSNA
ncbi:cytochrome P450 6k1-like [Zerene cesonia]|uniref:cytochrome P450 6k1-like n=1 Tax=Zerene cesonia TaxID=33412 RepID=UPI0018E57C05|nr:cytochrome P450 6k1-like [Zerene cesonia]